jgi:hypothetical protein
MSDFEEYCREALTDPAAHLALSQRADDLIPQPPNDKVMLGQSKIHGKGVFPADWFELGQEVGLLTDKQFRRTALIGRYINHDPNPSTRMFPGPRGMHLVARRPILMEDEITIDYRDVELLRTIVRKAGL